MSARTGDADGLFDCRKAWAATIEALAAEDERIVVVVNDSVGSSKLGGFKTKFPERTDQCRHRRAEHGRRRRRAGQWRAHPLRLGARPAS